jgi:aldose 1-epimerase
MQVSMSNYGGVITSILVPDRDGTVGNVVIQLDSLGSYLSAGNNSSLLGRYGNRIAGGRFTIDGQQYQLATNNGPNHLHGGPQGFSRKVWTAQPFQNAGGVGVVLTYVSPDGEEGYPGTLRTQVTYTLANDNSLTLDYRATTDRPTHVNLSHHVYFNLSADSTRDILGHEMRVNASRYTPVDSTLIPTGELASVAGTPFDFRQARPIGGRIEETHPQLRIGRGYDHNWVLDRQGDGLQLAARLREPTTGRVLEVHTTEPGMQIYTQFRRRHGIALETQHFPDTPNKANFPTTLIRPGQEYRSTTAFRFSVQP